MADDGGARSPFMREPLFDLVVPAQVGDSYESGDRGAERLVVVQDVYTTITHIQETVTNTIDTLCRRFAAEAGVGLVAVEGGDGPITTQAGGGGGEISAGVLSALRAGEGLGRIDVYGVDDMELRSRQRRAQVRLMASRPEVMRAFEPIRRMLTAARRRRRLPKPIARIRETLVLREVLGENREGLDLAEVIQLLQKAAADSRTDLGGYPALQQMIRSIGMENTFEFEVVERQKKAFAKRIMSGVESWFTLSGARVSIDLEKAVPYLQYWIGRLGVPLDEFYEAVGRHPDAVLGDCASWYRASIISRAQEDLYSARPGQVDFLEELMRLALFTGIPYFDLREFRRYVSYTREAGRLSSARLFEELALCSEELMEKMGAGDLARIERELDHLYQALLLELGPEPDTADLRPERLETLLADLTGQAGARPGKLAPSTTALKGLVQHAVDYENCSTLRGRAMAEHTLRLLHDHDEDRALLVVGGGNARAVSRALEDTPRVSWEVLAPVFDVTKAH